MNKDKIILRVLGCALVFSINSYGTEVLSACKGPQEQLSFSDSFPSQWRGPISDAFNAESGSVMFEKSTAILKSPSAPLAVREFSEYIRGKSYRKDGLDHVAYKKFQELASKELGAQVSLAGRIAAIECMTKLQTDLPSLSVRSSALSELLRKMLSRTDLSVSQRRVISHFLVTRMKELVNKWDKPEIEIILDSLKNEGNFLIYAQLLVVQRHGNYVKAVGFFEQLLEKGKLPVEFEKDKEALVLLYSRDLYEMKRFQKSADIVRMIPRDSNYLSQALSDLTWALLMAGKKREAVGTAFNIQKSLLNKTFVPEAPLVASIAYFEMCQYARALKNSVFFKKKYLPILNWYKGLTLEQTEKPYELLTASLRKKASVPNVVLLEWMRHPEFQALQSEANALYTERRVAYEKASEKVNGSWVRDWKIPMIEFYKGTKSNQRELGARLNKTLKNVNKKISSNISRLLENTQLLEIEIFDAAGEDMVWRNINPDYPKWASEQPDEKKDSDKYWVWGEVPVDPQSKDEIWEDELGWTLGNVDDECKFKNRYKQIRAKSSNRTASNPVGQ